MDQFIPKRPLNVDYYDEHQSLIPIRKSYVDLYDQHDSLIPQPLKSTSQYEIELQGSNDPYDRSYIDEIRIKAPIIQNRDSIDKVPLKFTIYDPKKDNIPSISGRDRYKENAELIPIVKTQNDLLRKSSALIKMKPWLASLEGILPLPPVLSSLAPNALLPPQFGMIARRYEGLIANPTPLNLISVMAELPSMVSERTKDKNPQYAVSMPKIKGRISSQADSFLGQQTTGGRSPTDQQENKWEFGTPTNLAFVVKGDGGSQSSVKEKYQQYQKTFKDSTLAYIKKRNQNFSKSSYIKNNMTPKGDYFQQIKNPVGFAFRTSSPNRSLTSSILQYGIDKDISNRVTIVDPLSYQIQSYRTPVFRGVTGPAESIAGSYQDKDSNFKGNLIKFWIKNLNDDSVMTTPAFISELQDGGGNGTWDQVSYVNAYYPQFIYKGAEKRTITFTLKLACFDKTYLPQYVEKLNFLRTVGFPYYKDVEIPRTNKLGQESNNASVSTLKVSLAKAPVFSLTLGDIINQQKGYFQACDFTWDDEQTTWNLNPKRMFRTQNISGGDKVLNILNELTNNTAHDSEWELPIVTTITCTFVCMYGRGPSSNYKDDDHYIYDTENLKTARNLERTNENLSNLDINGATI